VHAITASYSGDGNFAASTSPALSQTVKPLGTKTALAQSLSTTAFNQSVTFTAVVTSTVGVPTGTVTFKAGVTSLGSPALVAGKAVLSVSTLGVGAHSISAVYNGDVNHASSTSPGLLHTVIKAATSTALVSSVNPSAFNQSVTFTATVTPATSGLPTGSVTFKAGATTLGTVALAAGKAVLSVSTLSLGSHSITAVYNGDVDYNPSTSVTLVQTVVKAATSTTVVSSVNPSTFNQLVTFTAKVTPNTAGVPTGSVTFKAGVTTLGTGALSAGKATFSISTLSKTSHGITAVYGGDTNFLGSTSPAIIQVVN
jgi:Bacterial Ig-like domain (group 3)